MELVVLGSGGFLPQPDRPLPGFAVRHQGKVYLLDAGEGTQTRMVEHGVSSANLEVVCLSHTHGDHVFGLPGVMVRRSQEGRRRDELNLLGPRDLLAFLKGIEDAGSLGLLYDWNLQALEEGFSYRKNAMKITASALNHRVENYGFALERRSERRKFRPKKALELEIPEGPLRTQLQSGQSVTLEDGRTIEPEQVTEPPQHGPTIVYVTDTRPCYDFPEAFQGPELLIHEAMFTSEHQEQAREKKHCTAREAGRVARHLNADRLLITHFSHRYSSPEPLLDEARSVFERTETAAPGMVRQVQS